MASDNKVSVEITLEEKSALQALTKLTKQIQNTEKSFTDLGKEGDESLNILGEAGKGVSDGFGTLVKGVTIANLASDAIVGTANALKNFALDSVRAAIEAENATQKLGQSLRAVGAFSEQTVSDFLDYAGALSQVTVFSDDAITEQLAFAKSLGASNQQAKDLVKAATELSATFGGTLEQRVEELGKTFSGSAGRLGQLIPGFKDLTEAQLKNGEAIDLINSKYSGSALAQLDTYGGKLSQLSKAYGELQESIGAFVVESGASGVFESITFAINKYTESLNDAKIAQARQAGGLVETGASLEQLKRQYDELRVKAIELEQTIINPSFGAGSDKTALFIAKKQLAELNEEIARTKAQIDTSTPAVKAAQEAAPKGGATDRAPSSAEDTRVLKEQQIQIEIAKIREDARIAAEEQNALVYEATQGNRELEVEEIYAFEMQKLQATFDAEEQKAQLIKDSTEKKSKLQEISAKKELETTKLYNNQLKAEQQRKIKDAEATNAALIVSATNFLAAGQLIAKEGSNAQKALQITQATMATYAAANNALAQPVPYPVAVAMAASAVALGLANVAKIAGAKFEYGGIVGGNSMTGDSINARVNSGEMILNRQQQTSLFNQINSGSSGGNSEQLERLIEALNNQAIVLTLDGREIARSVRSQVQQGFKLTA